MRKFQDIQLLLFKNFKKRKKKKSKSCQSINLYC